jgi:hypothetical protein
MTAIVPTEDDFSALYDRVVSLERSGAIVLRPETYGAVAGQDCTDAFEALFSDLETNYLKPDAGGSVPVCRAVVLLGEGPYLISRPVMNAASGRAQGLTIQGLGKRVSEIVKTTPGPLLINHDRWMNVRIRDCSFRSTSPAAQFLYSYSTGAAQDWVFTNVEWRGTWDYGIGLDGTNTNSEFGWNNCFIGGGWATAFLYGGMDPTVAQQDQFLNYWFNDCKVEYTWGTFVRMDKGGFVKCQGGSYIITGTRPDGAVSRFFDFPLAGHYDSVCKLAVTDIRFELRNATHQVIRSAWSGHIVFQGVSDTALGFQSHSPGLIAHEYTNPGMVTYSDCDLVGKHAYHATGTLPRQIAVYQRCTRKNNRSATTFLVKDGANAASLKFAHRDDGDGIV